MTAGTIKPPSGQSRAAGDGLAAGDEFRNQHKYTSSACDCNTHCTTSTHWARFLFLCVRQESFAVFSAQLECVQERVDALERLALTDAANSLLWYERYLLARQAKATIERYTFGGSHDYA